MPLSPGDKLGPYEILAPVGARDPRLNRDVAIKVSAAQFTAEAMFGERPKRRLRDIGDAWDLLEPVEQAFGLHMPAEGPLHKRPPEQTLRYTIAAPGGSAVHSFAISPDGRYLAIAAAGGSGATAPPLTVVTHWR